MVDKDKSACPTETSGADRNKELGLGVRDEYDWMDDYSITRITDFLKEYYLNGYLFR